MILLQLPALRTVEIEGAPWFVAADACRCLSMTTAAGTGRWTKRLDADERQTVRRKTHDNLFVEGLFEGSENQLALISESGLYKLIMRSDKAEAVAFQNWVTREVLPAIRRTGRASP